MISGRTASGLLIAGTAAAVVSAHVSGLCGLLRAEVDAAGGGVCFAAAPYAEG